MLPSPSSLRWIYYLRTILKWGTGQYFHSLQSLSYVKPDPQRLFFSVFSLLFHVHPPSRHLDGPTIFGLH